jgi:hypothetical protein
MDGLLPTAAAEAGKGVGLVLATGSKPVRGSVNAPAELPTKRAGPPVKGSVKGFIKV